MKYAFLFVLIVFFPAQAMASGKCKTEEPYPYEAPYEMESCPEDIQGWMDRLNGCSHFESEMEAVDAADAERKAFLEGQMNNLQCAYLWCDYDALFAKYEGDVVYAGVITGYAGMIYGDNELPYCAQESEMPPEDRVGDEYLEE